MNADNHKLMSAVITQILDDVDASITSESAKSYQLGTLSAILGSDREAMRLCKMIATVLHASLMMMFLDETVVVRFER
jgi:hypothetical protein